MEGMPSGSNHRLREAAKALYERYMIPGFCVLCPASPSVVVDIRGRGANTRTASHTASIPPTTAQKMKVYSMLTSCMWYTKSRYSQVPLSLTHGLTLLT